MPFGVAAQLPDDLPLQFRKGRSSSPGPVAGRLECFSYFSNLLTGVMTLRRTGTKFIPGGFTVQAVSYRVRATTAAPEIIVRAQVDSQSSQGTDIMAFRDIAATPQDLLTGTELANRTFGADEPYLVVINRIDVTTMTDVCVTVWYTRHGHVNADSVND